MFIVLAALLWTGCSMIFVDPYLASGSGYNAVFVLEGSPPLISILTSTPEYHLVTVDPRTGERLAATQLVCATKGASPKLYPPAEGLAWVRCGKHEAYLVDLRTAQVVVPAEQLVANNPELGAGYEVRQDTITFDVAGPAFALPITLHDGRKGWLDFTATLYMSEAPVAPWVPGYFCWPEHKCSRARRECLGFIRASGGHGMVLSANRQHGESDREPNPVHDWPAGLLMPGLVGEPDSRCAFETEEQHLILHDSAAFEPKESLLSLYRRDGTAMWSVRYAVLGATAKEQPRKAVRLGDQILLLVGNTNKRRYLRTVFLDATTGEVTAAHDVFGQLHGL